nr:DNA helicase [Tanacetum cinerariifolium]
MYSHYLDALAICRALGNPQFFIMFTCNVNLLEIKRHMHHYPKVLPKDRADVVVWLFHQKVQHFLQILKGHKTLWDRKRTDHQYLEVVANNEASKMKTLTEWFEYSKFNTNGIHLTYLDFPKYFCMVCRFKGELFYLRFLLCHQKGCNSFEDIRTVNDRMYLTFRAACEALGFLGDDKEWDTALMEACFSKNKAEQILACLFASWLLDINNGKIREPDADDSHNSFWVTIPERYCIPGDNNGLSNLINFIYDKDTLQHPTAQELQHKAIVCPRNDIADIINIKILKMVDGFPPHELELKVGIPIMLLRNVNLQGGMCNGTRMIIKKLWSKLIEAEVITGNRVGEKVYIPPIMIQNCISDLHIGARNKILEAREYRKWLSRKPQRPPPLDYCFILIEREGNAIQASMGTTDIAYFNSILQAGAAHRISHFTSEGYQNHYFNFTTYNQLGYKLNPQADPLSQNQTTLTGRVDFYFDDILDKPLQIKDYATAEIQTLGETSSSAKGTLLLEMPDTHNPATPAAAVPIRQIPLPSPPSTVKEGATLTSQEVTVSSVSIDQTASMGNLYETEETKNDSAETLKRALFSTDPEEQKKNKSEQ